MPYIVQIHVKEKRKKASSRLQSMLQSMLQLQSLQLAATQLLDPISIPIQVGIRRVGGSLAESAPLVALKYR
jgi:hypothetical protein